MVATTGDTRQTIVERLAGRPNGRLPTTDGRGMRHDVSEGVSHAEMRPGSTGVRPARPHTGLTEEGRRVAEVLSYTRRGSRMSPRQQDAWESRAADWWIPDEAVDDPAFDVASWFGRQAPLVAEI